MLKAIGYIIVIAVILLNVLAFAVITEIVDPYAMGYTLGINARLVSPIIAAILTVAALFEMTIGLILISFHNLCRDTREIKEMLEEQGD